MRWSVSSDSVATCRHSWLLRTSAYSRPMPKLAVGFFSKPWRCPDLLWQRCPEGLRRSSWMGSPASWLPPAIPFRALRSLHDPVKFLVEPPFKDFADYYPYATVVAMGLAPFDREAVPRVDALLHIRRAGSAANCPPLFYLFMQPWALLPFWP